MINKSILIDYGTKVENKEMTWQQVAEQINMEYGTNYTRDAVRKQYYRMLKNDELLRKVETRENSDGTIEAQMIVEYNKEIFGDKNKLLDYLGYNHNEWEFVFVSMSVWQQHTKEQTTKEMYAVKFKVKPLESTISIDKAVEIAKEIFSKEITPFNKPTDKDKKISMNVNKLMEIPAIELHLGKMAWGGDTGQDYDKDIAQDRFNHILEEICNMQDQEQCGTALITIGNDFFNSDTVNATTTKGTPQTNDLRWKKMFLIGLEMYTTALLTLREKFDKLDIRLCSGNHDKMASFYLYLTLQQYFRLDDKIQFSDNYKDYQCYQFGNNAIFFGHGDGNINRIIKSIPCEFYKEWGTSKYRELHLGHLHKEVVVDDDSGIITRRIGSPTGIDQWHYEERFIGATQKHQIFIWNKETGLESIKYINFENTGKKKVLIRR